MTPIFYMLVEFEVEGMQGLSLHAFGLYIGDEDHLDKANAYLHKCRIFPLKFLLSSPSH